MDFNYNMNFSWIRLRLVHLSKYRQIAYECKLTKLSATTRAHTHGKMVDLFSELYLRVNTFKYCIEYSTTL